jgi:DNA-binding CsgD family transcriptional regulator
VIWSRQKIVPDKEAPSHVLTEAQMRVARLVAAGLKDNEIMEQLGLSREGVQFQTRAIRKKIGARRRLDIVAWYARIMEREQWQADKAAALNVIRVKATFQKFGFACLTLGDAADAVQRMGKGVYSHDAESSGDSRGAIEAQDGEETPSLLHAVHLPWIRS